MKQLILIIGAIVLILNILLGAIISNYDLFNVCLNCVVIILNATLIYILNVIKLKDAFRISLSLFFSMAFLLEFVLGLFASSGFKDNWYLIVGIIILSFEIIILFVTNKSSKQ